MENYKNAKVATKRIDACDYNGQISVVVHGEISNNNEPSRRFTQTFLLAPQDDNSSAYYVLSDIFGYIDNIWPTEEAEHVREETQTSETGEYVELYVSEAKTSTAETVVLPEEQPKEEQNAEEAKPVVEEPPVEKKCPVVKETPEPITKAAEPSLKDIQESQKNTAPIKKSWATVEATSKYAVPSFIEIEESQQEVGAVKMSQAKLVTKKSKTSYTTPRVKKATLKPVQAHEKPAVS